jgi:hypothetical protein
MSSSPSSPGLTRFPCDVLPPFLFNWLWFSA